MRFLKDRNLCDTIRKIFGICAPVRFRGKDEQIAGISKAIMLYVRTYTHTHREGEKWGREVGGEKQNLPGLSE